jgi:hypothetical protein
VRRTAVVFGSTYRLQLGRDFAFDEAERRLGYLKQLGIDCVYCPPILRSFSAQGRKARMVMTFAARRKSIPNSAGRPDLTGSRPG